MIYRCTVRVFWDLWWFGDASKGMGPFNSHKAEDYMLKRQQSYLSRGRKVMEKIEVLLKIKEPDLDLSQLNISGSRAKFATGFDDLCSYLSPGATILELDRKHYGDAMYLSFYERLLKHKKKRKLALIEDANAPPIVDADANAIDDVNEE